MTGTASTGTTAGALAGYVNLTGDAALEFGSGEITSIASNSQLNLNGSNSYVEDSNATGSNSALTGLASNAGNLEIEGGASVTTANTFDNTNFVSVDFYNNGNGGSTLDIGTDGSGALTNSGTIDLGNSNLSVSDAIKAASLDNTNGTINIQGNSTVQALFDVTGTASTGTTAGALAGYVNLYQDAALEFGSGEITSIASNSQLSLNGSNSYVEDSNATGSNSALTGLASNAGNLEIEGGASVTTANTFDTTDLVSVDFYNNGNGGSTLNIGAVGSGALTNSGTIDLGNSNLSVSDEIKAASLDNIGTINVNASAAASSTLSLGAGGYTQNASGSLNLGIEGTAAGQYGTLTATGGVNLQGGTLGAYLNITPVAGQTFIIETFASGKLAGIYNTLYSNYAGSGDGTSVSDNGLTYGLVYNNNLGNIELEVVATPASTADTTTQSGNFSSISYSNGAPTFYTDLTIGGTSTIVTLNEDATINSLTLNAGDVLTSQSSTDLSIGSGITLASGAALTIGGEAFADGGASNAGTISVAGTILDIRGDSSGTGTYTIDNGAMLEFGAAESNQINFNSATAVLKLDQPASVTGKLNDLVAGDIVDLAGTAVSGTSENGDTLTVTESDGSTLTYTLSNQQSGTAFTTQSDGAGGTDLVLVTTVQPAFTSVNETPSSGDLDANKSVSFTLSPNVSAVVAGTPTLTLNDGGIAYYDAAKSSAMALVFDYTVASGQNTASLAATAINLQSGASIKDNSGDNFDLALNGLTQTGPAIDTTPPTVAINGSGGNVTAASQTITGTVDTSDAGTTVDLYDNGSATVLGTATVQQNGTWSTTVTLVSGSNSLVAKDTDVAGNTGASSPVVYNVGITPTVTEALADDSGSSSTDKITNTGTVTGSADAGATVSFKIDGTAAATTATADGSGVYTYTPVGLADGSHTIVASETNGFGTGSTSLTFTLDTTPPTVGINGSGGNVTAASQTITGTVDTSDAGTTVDLYDNGSATVLGTATVQQNGTWSTTVTLVSGSNSLVAKDTDVAGNTGASSPVVYNVGQIFTLTKNADVVSGTAGNDIVVAASGTLSAGDQIDGGGGSNTLELTGAGSFNLALPSALTDISIITAQEGQAAYSGNGQTFAAQNQIVDLRSGLNVTVDVSSDPTFNPNNAKAATITIVGANDSDTINLASGNDVVTVGSAAETINLGSGNNTISVSSATIGATIGNGTGQNLLNVTGGGTMAMGPNINSISTVQLSNAAASYNFTANAESGLTITDASNGFDTIQAGGANQTLTGGGAGKLTMIGSEAGSDIFKNSAAAFNGDTIGNFGAANDAIDFTNIAYGSNFSLGFSENNAGTSGVLTVSNGAISSSVTLLGQFIASEFQPAMDSAGTGTVITYQPNQQQALLAHAAH